MSIRNRIRKTKHLRNRHLICVLENPNDIKNVATVIRNLSAFGVEKLYIISDKKGVPYNLESSRKNKYLTRLSVGANKWIFIKRFTTTDECALHLKKNLYTNAITSPHQKDANNINLYEGTFTQKRLAVWFGNESHGISKKAIKHADMCIQVPMRGVVESLNLATSTGIILSFISYQRLKFIFTHSQNRFKPQGFAKLITRSWHNFLNCPHDNIA